MPFPMDNTGEIKVHNIYFPYQEETNDLVLLLDPRRERLIALKRTLGAPFCPLRSPAGLEACL